MVLCAGVSCWPNVNEPPLGCWLLLPPKLKVLGVVLNVFGGVNVVLGPVKGDADRALPPLFRLAILLGLALSPYLRNTPMGAAELLLVGSVS